MQSSKGIKVQINDAVITINGNNLPLPCSLDDVVNLFGKQSRLEMLANILCTWDHLGIYARMGIFDLVVSSIGFAYSPYDVKFFPASFFEGELTVDGFPVTSKLAAASFESIGFSADDPGKDFWVREYGKASLRAILKDGVFCCVEVENT